MNTETIHVTERTGKTVSCHGVEEDVEGGRLLSKEVVSRVMSSSSLGNLVVGLRLEGVDHIGEENTIIDEEDWVVDTDNICPSISAHVLIIQYHQNSPRLPSSV